MQQLAQQPDTKIFATARDPAKADALNALAKEKGNVVVVQWRADVFEDAKAVGEAVKAQGVLDVFIANAGMCFALACPVFLVLPVPQGTSTTLLRYDLLYRTYYSIPLHPLSCLLPFLSRDTKLISTGIAKNNSPVATADPAHVAEHITVNVSANIVLFQAVYPLLEASSRGGVYMPISSQIGSIGQGMAFPNFAYAMSKTALNFMAQKVSVEHEKIKVIIVQ